MGGGVSSACFVQAVEVLERGSLAVSSEILGSRRQSSSLTELSFLGTSGESGRDSAIALDIGTFS